MGIEVDTIDGPSFLASALINGDHSGLEPRDEKTLKRFLNDLPEGAYIVDCEEETWFGQWHGIGHDMVTYTYHVQTKGT